MQSNYNLPQGQGNKIRRGVNRFLADRYRDTKAKFKNKYFTSRGGVGNVNALKDMPPENMNENEWHDLLKYYMEESTLNRSDVNRQNRTLQQYTSHHGTKSYVEYRHEQRELDDDGNYVYPSLIEGFRAQHSRNGNFTSLLAKKQYEEMCDKLEKYDGTKTEDEIMDEVLGIRRGHLRGRGRIVSEASSSSSHSISTKKVASQADLKRMYNWMHSISDKLESQGMEVPPVPLIEIDDDSEDDEDDENDIEDD